MTKNNICKTESINATTTLTLNQMIFDSSHIITLQLIISYGSKRSHFPQNLGALVYCYVKQCYNLNLALDSLT